MGLLDMLGFESKATKEMKRQQIIRCRQIFTDSFKIMQSTANLETFLSRYQLTMETLRQAGEIAGMDKKCLGGVSPREAIETLQRDLPALLNPCLERFIHKKTISICQSSSNRIKKAKALYGFIFAYEDQLPSESLVYWRFLVDGLVEKVERIEASGI